jgi:hypothetical protein
MSVKPGTRITLSRCRHALVVQPPCADLLGQLRTIGHTLVSDGNTGCHLRRQQKAIYRSQTPWENPDSSSTAVEPVGMTLVGLEPAVRHLLRENGDFIEGPAPVRQLPAADLDTVQRHSVADDRLLDVVQCHDRALVRCGRKADPAWIIGQIALAYPGLSITVAAARKREAGITADQLRQWLPGAVTLIRNGSIPQERGQIVVGTYQGLLGGCVDLDRRDLLVALDAVEMLGKYGIQVFNAAGDARQIGLLPDDRKLAPRDADQLRGVFGFEEVHVPRHGHHLLPVDVVFEKINGGPVIPKDADVTTVRRFGVWRSPVRNRRIAALARALTENDPGTLQDRFRRVYGALSGRRDLRVAVLTDNVEHGVTLARRLPGWPVVTGREVCVKGLPRKDRDLLESVGTTSGAMGNGIYTVAAADQIDPCEIDVLIRADSGSGLPPVEEAKGLQENRRNHRLLLLDFDDRRHNEHGRSTRKRRRAYRARGWYGPGADPVEERVRDFLASRPKD